MKFITMVIIPWMMTAHNEQGQRAVRQQRHSDDLNENRQRCSVRWTSVLNGMESMMHDDFYAGICVALAEITVHDAGTLWRDIVDIAGREEVTKHAKKHGQMRIAGFTKYEKKEFGNRI